MNVLDMEADMVPSPARGAPHRDEFGSLGREPSQTRTCMGTFRPCGYCERQCCYYRYEVYLLFNVVIIITQYKCLHTPGAVKYFE
jgi:hypothetical protein